ncbi:methyl-accepting chemotaxis protein [Paracidovorax avenae]|uniref:methyl-accepting chemotaxis protein n=2 Tax=Paracidovorax avenae TaxID=80867 RepID=UPI000D1517AE|nr:methyl-accepting chemotaxis protein [Paracidovorax avenae]AVS63077.1 methyl-accepting chemotaxis protein [Paracidovorax avenae]
MNFSSIKLAPRLGFAFASMGLLTVLLGLFCLRQMSHLNEQTTMVADSNLPTLVVLSDYRGTLERMRRQEVLMLLDAPEAVRERARVSFDELAAKFDELNRIYVGPPLIDSPEKAVLAEALKKDLAAYVNAAKHIRAGSSDPARHAELVAYTLNDARKHYMSTGQRLDEVVEYNVKQSKEASAEALHLLNNSRNWLIVSMVAAAGLAALLAVVIVRSIVRPLNRAIDAAQQVAEGNLAVELRVDGRDEVSRLLGALLHMRDNLARITSDVRRNAEGVATASAQIAQGNSDLSSRTEQQAAALQQTAASMAQLGATVRQNADSARQASQLAVNASGIASQGGEVVGEVVETMKGINEASRRIGDIIGVIDSIAFQTNILALNAAVEAARAGEQGRGFAVVASEVRSLAQRSAEAAKEIKSLIGNSVDRVEQGSALVDKAGATMEEVVMSIRRLTDIVAEISAASSEQSEGVSQVEDAVSQMDHATQQNAALVEESAAAAGSLRTQADQLVQAMSFFRTVSGIALSPRTEPVAQQPAPVRAMPARQATPKARAQAAAPGKPKAELKAGSGLPAKPALPAAPAAKPARADDDWESF